MLQQRRKPGTVTREKGEKERTRRFRCVRCPHLRGDEYLVVGERKQRTQAWRYVDGHRRDVLLLVLGHRHTIVPYWRLQHHLAELLP